MHINKVKKDAIRRAYIAQKINIQWLAEKLELRPSTIRFYINEFTVLEQQRPDKLKDFDFFIGKDKVTKATKWYLNFSAVISELVKAEPGPCLVGERLFQQYHKRFPMEYSKPRFYYLFKRWLDEHERDVSTEKLAQKFTPAELDVLRRWRKGNDRRLWQVSVVLMTMYTYQSFGRLAKRIESTQATLRSWLKLYREYGLEGVNWHGHKKPISESRKTAIDKKMDDLVHLVRQSPKLHGINKTSWTITDLTYVYGKVSGKEISLTMVRLYLKRRGVRFKRAREVLVSSDPKFHEKFEKIQDTLRNLGEHEKFFSIDEYGPKSVRPKGGRQLVLKGQLPVYQKVDKSKGWFICTCALELSTNQLNWFYSRKKDTEEMIKLIDMLSLRYQAEDRLYLSWDAASWHDSQQLHDYLSQVNETEYREKLHTPEILLIPLPAKAPHLNVIESVFSGMAKSVIHNSDYESVESCTEAIDLYFNERNTHFLLNPKHAGRKIWGKEKVKPVFNKANICRNIG